MKQKTLAFVGSVWKLPVCLPFVYRLYRERAKKNIFLDLGSVRMGSELNHEWTRIHTNFSCNHE